MDRLTFLDSISGIQYPEMLVHFFDQFLALKQLIEDNGSLSVNNNTDTMISFIAIFNNKKVRDTAWSNINTNCVIIYGKPVSINVDIVSDTEINIILQ